MRLQKAGERVDGSRGWLQGRCMVCGIDRKAFKNCHYPPAAVLEFIRLLMIPPASSLLSRVLVSLSAPRAKRRVTAHDAFLIFERIGRQIKGKVACAARSSN